MKKLLLTLLATLFAIPLIAQTFPVTTEGIDLFYTITGNGTANTCAVAGPLNKKLLRATIPATVTYEGTTYTVTSVGTKAFQGCQVLESVTLPPTINSIEEFAFQNCVALSEIELPEGLTAIRRYAFNRCYKLPAIKLPSSLTTIGDQAFNACTALTSIEIPDGITNLPAYAFGFCSNLTSVKLPKSLKSIGNFAFARVPITSIDLPETLTSIGIKAFSSTKLKSVDIPTRVTELGANAFEGCSMLESITLPSTLTELRRNTFYACSQLKSIALPPSIKKVEASVFNQCTSLSDVYIGANVEEIGDSAFYSAGLQKLYITRQGPVNVGLRAFGGNTSVRTLYTQGTAAATYFSGAEWDSFATKTMLDEAVGMNSFNYTGGSDNIGVRAELGQTAGCSVPCPEGVDMAVVTAIITPAGESSIPCIFWSSSDPSKLYVDNNGKISFQPGYSLGDNVTVTAQSLYSDGPCIEYTLSPVKLTYTRSGTSATCTGAESKDITSLVIPETVNIDGIECKVVSVGGGAFREYAYLTTVKLPSSLYSIGDRAFQECQKLRECELPEGLQKIGIYAFIRCYALESIYLPRSLTSIGQQAFNACRSLTSIDIPDGITELSPYVFGYCYSLTSVKLPRSLKTIGNYAFDRDPIESIEIPETVTSIGYRALSRTNLKNVVLPNSVATLGERAFAESEMLESVTLSNSIATIDNLAFEGCKVLNSIVVPPSVTKIGVGAFRKCPALTSVYMGPNIEAIGDSAFMGTNIKELYITRQSEVTLGKDVFRGLMSPRLYVQGATASGLFTGNDWSAFTKVQMNVSSQMNVRIGGGTKVITANVGTPVTTQIPCQLYGSARCTATLGPTDVSIPFTFWRSSDPSKLYVDNFGRITMRAAYNEGDDVTVTAESLYADGPQVNFSVKEALLTYRITNAESKLCAVTGIDDKDAITEVIIPSTTEIDGETYTVTLIDNNAFYDATLVPAGPYQSVIAQSSLSAVTLPPTLRNIGAYAFKQTALTEISLPEGIEGIGRDAFHGCVSLKSVSLPETLTAIGAYSFARCRALPAINLPKSLRSIGDQAFNGCSSLQSVEVPEGITQILGYTFGYCYALKSVKLPKSLKTIGDYAFDNDPIETIEIPEKVTSIGRMAFARTNLQNVVIPNNVTTIRNEAFKWCKEIETIVLPNGIEEIGRGTFYDCPKLRTIILPPSVKRVGALAFYNCGALTTAYAGPNVESIGDSAFFSSGLQKLYLTRQSSLSVGTKAFDGTASSRTLYIQGAQTANLFTGDVWSAFATKVPMDVPTGMEGCNRMIEAAFGQTVRGSMPCQDGVAVTLSATMLPVADAEIPYIFWTSSNYDKLFIDQNGQINMGPDYDFDDDVVLTAESLYAGGPKLQFTLEGAELIYEIIDPINRTCRLTGTNNPRIVSIVIPQLPQIGNGAYTLKEIADGALRDHANLTSVTLPETLTAIGQGVFENCSGLRSVEIPKGVSRIPASAFKGCSSLSDVELSSSVTAIGQAAFEGCAALSSLSVPEKVTTINPATFRNCSALTGIELPEIVKSIGESAFEGCAALTSIIIPDDVTAISQATFKNCTSLASVVMDNSVVTGIGKEAFAGCAALKTIDLPSSVKSLGDSCFASAGLTSMDVPVTVIALGDRVFEGCVDLTSLSLPNTEISLGKYAFSGTGLRKINLPSSLTSLPDGLFCDTKLTEIALPPAVTAIGANSFDGCTQLTNVYLGSNISAIGEYAFRNAGLQNLYIVRTGTELPSVGTGAFTGLKSTAELHLQGEAAENAYRTARWGGFNQYSLIATEAHHVELRKGSPAQASAYAPQRVSDSEALYNTPGHIYAMDGDTFQRSATAVAEDGTQATVPHTFWTSSDPASVYVSSDGNISVNRSLDKPVVLTARSLSDNVPEGKVTVVNYIMTGVDEIFEEDGEEGLDADAPARIFTIDGLPAGTSLNGLAPGIYVVVQGKKKVKINIR